MNWLQQQLQNTPPPDTILHLGAGLCRELPYWLESGASRIVLVEPNPELLPELRARTEGHQAVEIVGAAIAGQAGRGALRLFNFPLLSSLRSPTGLYQSLPGLRDMGRVTVDLLTIEKLLSQLGMAEKTNNWLVIDAPGEEADIICQLLQVDRMHDFSRVFLSAGNEALYDGAKAAAELLGLLEPVGFEHAGRADQADADWPRYHLVLNRLALECRALRSKLEEAHALVDREIKRADQLAEERDHLQVELDESRKAYQAEVDGLQQQLVELTEQMNQEAERLRIEQEQGLKAHAAELHAAGEALAKANEESKRKQEELQNLQAKLTSAEKEVNALRQRQAELEQSNRKLHEEYQRKEALIDEEFLKAESQLELIKELVFRDKPV